MSKIDYQALREAAEEAEELARIALASLEAEPVVWMCDNADGREYNA